MTQFSTAKQFASHMAKTWDRAYTKSLNENDYTRRLRILRDACERYSRTDIYEENALPRGYNPAAYGLWLVVTSGRVNGQTVGAIRAMTMRQLCELVHVLLTECGDLACDYARFLMERYTTKEVA